MSEELIKRLRGYANECGGGQLEADLNEVISALTQQTEPVAMVADPRVGRWTLTSPDGRMFFGDSQLAALREERNSRLTAAEQLENIRKGMDADQVNTDTVSVPTVPTDAMRDAGNEIIKNRSQLFQAWNAMLRAAQEGKK